MITLTYIHNHECAFKGAELVIHPNVDMGAYFRPMPVCVETKTELLMIGEGTRIDAEPS